MTPRRWMLGIALGSVLLLNGCKHCCKRSCAPQSGGPPGPAGGPPTLPPQNIPLDPTPRTGMRIEPEVLLPSTPPATSGYQPLSRSIVVLGEPDFDKPAAPLEEKKMGAKPPPPAASVDENPMSLPFPTGISGYAQVKEGVSSGMRPDLDGLDWLQSKGDKTVLFLRNGKEDDSSDRKQVANRSMKYVSLKVTPETINPELVTEFNRLVNDADGRPIFVYDLDGKLAGPMWYLYFRTSEQMSDEESRTRASRLGLKDKGDAEQTQLWTAVQKYLSERNPN